MESVRMVFVCPFTLALAVLTTAEEELDALVAVAVGAVVGAGVGVEVSLLPRRQQTLSSTSATT